MAPSSQGGDHGPRQAHAYSRGYSVAHSFVHFGAVPLLLPPLERAVEMVVPSSQVETWCGAQSCSSAAAQVRAYEQGTLLVTHLSILYSLFCSYVHGALY